MQLFFQTISASPVVNSPVRLEIALGVAFLIVIVAITIFHFHPFISLLLASVALAAIAGVPGRNIMASFTVGFGTTVGDVGLLVGLGSIIGAFLTISGGASTIVSTVVERTPQKILPWVIAAIAITVGIPLFFEVGIVMFIPVVMMIVQKTGKPLMLLGIPALAGLSVLHGFIPPHPGPLAIVQAINAPLGLTIIIGFMVAIPTVIIAGPVFAYIIARHIVPPAVSGADGTDDFDAPLDDVFSQSGSGHPHPRVYTPALWHCVGLIMLPVGLMLLPMVFPSVYGNFSYIGAITKFLGQPVVAIGITALLAMITLNRYIPGKIRPEMVNNALMQVASIIFIVGAGGGLKQTIIDTHIDQYIASNVQQWHLSPFIAAWCIAVFIRLATGSATVATVTTAGFAAHLSVTPLMPAQLALLVLVIGAGSLFFSHVSDAGFWLVKEYFDLTIKQTFATFSCMECIISLMGLIMVLLLNHYFIA